jgi:hypothetical protein
MNPPDENYDIFERLSDGKLLWRAVVPGLDAANLRLAEHAAQTRNEVVIMHLPTSKRVASMKIWQPHRLEWKIGGDTD